MRLLAKFFREITLCGALLVTAGVGAAAENAPQETLRLTLVQAIDLALKNNHGLAIGQYKVDEMNSALRIARSDYYPKVSNSSSYLHFTQTSALQFSQGAFGTFPGLGALPTQTLTVPQGNLDNIVSRSQIAQPITQLFKIRDADRAARAGELAARADLEGFRNQVALGVRQLYYGILAVELDEEAALEQLQVAEGQLREAGQDVSRGNALEVQLIGAQTSLLQAKQDTLTVGIRHSDLLAQFKNVVGIPQRSRLELEDQAVSTFDMPGKEECIQLAQSAAPEIKSAEETVRKVGAAVAAARAEYIPDVTAFARHDYQNGVAFLFHNYGVVGIGLNYTLFDGGKRKAMVSERLAQRAQATENLRRLKDDAAVNVEKALDKIEQSRSLVEVAKQAVMLREEGDRLAGVQLRFEVIVNSKRSEAKSAVTKAHADLLKAELGYMQSQAELEVLIGRLPRQ
jgi:outer membrane protein TolC